MDIVAQNLSCHMFVNFIWSKYMNIMYCHNLEVTSLKTSWVELGVCSTSVLSCT